MAIGWSDLLTSPAARKRRVLIASLAVAATILLGITVASQFDLSTPLKVTAPEGHELIITEITLGTPLNAGEATKPAPKLRQAAAYTPSEPLALRITTDPQVAETTSVSVRLVNQNGEITELDPSQVTLSPGTSTYCCWLVNRPGDYIMQIFRPERIITTLPLTIK